MATTRIILNLDGSIIDKVNGHITANSQYAHKIQVISPFPSSDSISLEWYLRNARITTYSQYIGLLKDDSGNPILASAIVDSSKEYYQTIKDWYVWQVAIDSQALAAISRYHAGKVDLTVKFKEFRNLYIEEAITDKGTFGSRKSTTGGDLPATSTEGDYYVCDFLDYYSVVTEEDYTLSDYAYYTDSAWLKGVAYLYRLNSSIITLTVDPSVLGQDIESVAASTGELLASQIAALESIVLGALPEDYAAALFVRKEIDLNYTELSPLPTDQILIERVRDTYYTNLADIMLGVDELESDIIRTHNAISATEGSGFYADATDVVIGSAVGDGISWSSTLGLFFRGTIQSGTITDAALLAELKGDTGDSVFVRYSANSNGSAMTVGIEVDTEYMGLYIGTEASTDYTDYTWSKFIATDGVDGGSGDAGISFNYIGVLTYVSDLDFIVDPTQNDAYRITEPNNELWIWSGTEWLNMGAMQGENAEYIMISGEQTFKFLEGQIVPTYTSIVLTASLSSGLTLYNWKYWDGSAWITLSGDATSETYTLQYNASEWGTASVLRVRCETGDYYDETTIVKLYDGTDGLTGLLTNENVSLTSDADGTGYSLTNAGGTFLVYKGIIQLTSGITFSCTNVSNPNNGLRMVINATTGVYYVEDETNPDDWTSSEELFELSAIYNGTEILKQYTISKSAQGITGPGLTFRGVWVASTNYYYDLVRHDVVEHPASSQTYYTVKVQGTLNKATFSTDDWTVMTSFEAIATDLLLAQNATILKGLVMGSAGTTTEPFIRSHGKTSLSAGAGFYLEGTGKFNFGDATTYVDWDGTDLTIKGDVEADSLTINADLTVTNDIILGTGGEFHSLGMDSLTDTTGGVFIQSDGKFIFGNPSTKSIGWDGADLVVKGSLSGSTGTFGTAGAARTELAAGGIKIYSANNKEIISSDKILQTASLADYFNRVSISAAFTHVIAGEMIIPSTATIVAVEYHSAVDYINDQTGSVISGGTPYYQIDISPNNTGYNTTETGEISVPASQINQDTGGNNTIQLETDADIQQGEQLEFRVYYYSLSTDACIAEQVFTNRITVQYTNDVLEF